MNYYAMCNCITLAPRCPTTQLGYSGQSIYRAAGSRKSCGPRQHRLQVSKLLVVFMSHKHHQPVPVAAQDQAAIKRAKALWKLAESFFAREKYEAAVDAGEMALEQVKDNRQAFEQRGEWEEQLDAWRLSVGDPEAIDRCWRRRIFGLMPAWLVLVVAIANLGPRCRQGAL